MLYSIFFSFLLNFYKNNHINNHCRFSLLLAKAWNIQTSPRLQNFSPSLQVSQFLKIISFSLRYCGLFFQGPGKHLSLLTMEDQTNHYNGLSITNREGLNFDLEEGMAPLEFIIAAKFFTRQALNIDAIAATFTPLWRSKNGFKVKNMGSHIVLSTFDKCMLPQW